MKTAQQTMDHLMEVEKKISKFRDQPLNTRNRAQLAKTIKELTSNGNNFYRKDNGQVVGLYWGQESMIYGMSPDIIVTVADNKIHVDTWSLWKTIKGYDEIVKGG